MLDAEVELWTAYRSTHAIADRNALVEYFLPFLKGLSTHFHQTLPHYANIDRDDLLSELVDETFVILDRFDLTRGVTFQTYAAPRLRGRMRDYIRNLDWVPRLERVRQKRDPDHHVYRMIALDGPAGGGIGTFGHKGSNRVRCFDAAAAPIQSPFDADDFWREACKGLNREERLIVLMYFREDMTLKAIGESIGLSESRISQMMTSIKSRLRERCDFDSLKVA